jgi:hypothetical protein
VWTDLPLG